MPLNAGPAVVLGDPAYFAVLHGSNPHTRTIFGRKKRVDREVARAQWRRFSEILRDRGVAVHVLPAAEHCPGLVYPANAGIVRGSEFFPSNLIPARAPERPYYEVFFREHGFDVIPFGSGRIRFEGEADFFRWGDRMIFTYGNVESQRLAVTWRFPFYRRIYGFRSEQAALPELSRIVSPREVIDLELCDERYYHGDTCLCSFGLNREFLLAYLPALTPVSREKIRAAAKDKLIELSDADAACYSANAYSVVIGGIPHLFLTESASAVLKRRLTDLGVRVVEINVSEFLKKGGGSVKCMVFDLSL